MSGLDAGAVLGALLLSCVATVPGGDFGKDVRRLRCLS